MITSTNVTRIKDWLTANSEGVRQALESVLPDAWMMQADRELTEQTNASQTLLDTQDFKAALGRYQQLVSAYNELRSLAANIDLELLRNQNQYDIAVLEGDIKRELASLRGVFKSELATLEGENALDLAELENQGRLALAQEIIPLDRDGKLKIANVKGLNDAEVQALDNAMKLALSQIRGAFDVKMAELDASVIDAESAMTVSSIEQQSGIEINSLSVVSANEVRYITGKNSIDISGIQYRTLIENQNRTLETNAEIDGIAKAAKQDAFYIDNAATLKGGFTDRSAVVRTGSITKEAGLSAGYETLINVDDKQAITHESEQRVIQANSETGLKIAQVKREGTIERKLNFKMADLEAQHAIALANKEVGGIAAALSERLFWAGKVVTTETGAIIDAAELEGGAIVQQTTDDMINKQLTTQIELGSRKEVNRIELQAIGDENLLEMGFADARSTAKIGNLNSATDNEVGTINGVTQAKNAATVNLTKAKQDALTDKAKVLIDDIKNGTLVKTGEINARATIMDTYTRGQADLHYTNATLDADNWADLAIKTAEAEIDLAGDYADWAEHNEYYVNTKLLKKKVEISNAGKMRGHVKYTYQDVSSFSESWPEQEDWTPPERPFEPPEFSVKEANK